MSANTLGGHVKLTIKLPREEYQLLQRFKGGTDNDKICRIVEAANASYTRILKAEKEKFEAEALAKAEASQVKPGLIARWFKKGAA